MFRRLLHGSAPVLPRRGGIAKRPIPNVRQVLAVASGKGGVGKSTVAVNLAFALALGTPRLRVGVLDLDVFGPSIPTLLGLTSAAEPEITKSGAIIPLTNHGIPNMSIAYLLPESTPENPTALVWRGLMVQKAVQQLLFDVDWSATSSGDGEDSGLDILVVDLPPGTGDVPLSLAQLVPLTGAVIVAAPQDVALADVRKGVSMFRTLKVPIIGAVLNTAYFVCPSCTDKHYLYGSNEAFKSVCEDTGLRALGELPLVGNVSKHGDEGVPTVLRDRDGEWAIKMGDIASEVRKSLGWDESSK